MNLQDRTEAVLTKGKQERGQFTPEPNSVPTRLYNFWVNEFHDGEYPRNENFCHFWRVVVIWAPITWLLVKVVFPFFESRAMKVVGRVLAKPFALVHRGYTSLGTERSRKKFWDRVGYGVVGLMGLIALCILGWIALQETGAFFIVLGILVGVVAIVIGLFYVGDLLTRERRAKKAAAQEARRQAWYRDEISDAEYFGGPQKPPGRVKKFFAGLGDFFVLIANVVRVKKWKICPLVEVPRA